ncbi:hypothetical protein niasHT_027028 [Heterodera trifolii]|uniref:Uncharacterized protein n=1 Tax=Heterodera trifolii TaxID=157864 RepID=A0ABD2JT43_9BILA
MAAFTRTSALFPNSPQPYPQPDIPQSSRISSRFPPPFPPVLSTCIFLCRQTRCSLSGSPSAAPPTLSSPWLELLRPRSEAAHAWRAWFETAREKLQDVKRKLLALSSPCWIRYRRCPARRPAWCLEVLTDTF